jgi:hypothetical protein
MSQRTSSVDLKFKKRVHATFDAKCISADAGVLLLGQLDSKLGLTKRLAESVRDKRRGLVEHTMAELVSARVLAIAQGYEDCNDFKELRKDPLFQTTVGEVGRELASQPTLSRFENATTVEDMVAMKSVLLEHFIARHRREGTTPKRLTLDVDSTDDKTHGQQEFSAFNGFYDSYVYLQLLVTTAEGDLLHVALMPPKLNLRSRAVMAIDEVVTRLRQEWPRLELRLRADNGFATPDMYSLCEKHRVEYFINAGSHAVFQEAPTTVEALALAEKEYQADESRTVMVYAEMKHQAKSWEVERRIVIKAQRTPVGPDMRFLVTNSKLTPKGVYEEYSQRGQAENFIKDFKRGVLGDRLSCHRFAANALRLLLHAVAYQLMHELRRLATDGLRVARLETLRLVVLRVAALVTATARRLRVQMSQAFPHRSEWVHLAAAISAIG